MTHEPTSSWAELFWGRNGLRSLTLAGGTALHAINIYIVTTIMPSVVKDIGGLHLYAMNTTLFVVASIVGAIIGGRTADRFGAKRVYLLAFGVFSLALLVCSLATSMPMLIAGRTIEGLAGGVLVSMAYYLIPQIFPQHLWTRAIGMLSVMWGVAQLLGPAIGGVFAELGSWRSAFWSLQPVVWLLVLAVIMWLPSGKPGVEESPPPPFAQLFFVSASVICFSIAGVSAEVWLQATFVVLGLGLLAQMIRIDRHAELRILPSGSYERTALRSAYVTMGLLAGVMSIEVFLPYFLQGIHGYSPVRSGYLTSVMAGGWSLGSLATAGLSPANGRRVVRFGPILMAVSLLCFSWTILQRGSLEHGVGFAFFLLNLLGIGLGIGVAWTHLLSYVLKGAPKSDASVASSSISSMQLFSMAVGSAAAGLIVNASGVQAEESLENIERAGFWLFFLFGLCVVASIGTAFHASASKGRSDSGEAPTNAL